MTKSESVVASRLDEILPNESEQLLIEFWAHFGWEQLQDGRAMEHSSLDSGPLEDGALAGIEAIDSGCEQRMDARWQGGVSTFRLEREELFEKERISLRVLDCALSGLLRHPPRRFALVN